MNKIINKKKKDREIIPVTVTRGAVNVLGRLALLDKKQLHAVLATVSGNKPYTSLIAYGVYPITSYTLKIQ